MSGVGQGQRFLGGTGLRLKGHSMASRKALQPGVRVRINDMSRETDLIGMIGVVDCQTTAHYTRVKLDQRCDFGGVLVALPNDRYNILVRR